MTRHYQDDLSMAANLLLILNHLKAQMLRQSKGKGTSWSKQLDDAIDIAFKFDNRR